MLPKPFTDLIQYFSSLPSVGPKMAERLVLHLFKRSPEDITSFAKALESLATLQSCARCHNVSDQELCAVCRDTKRDGSVIAVVEDALDAIAIERAHIFEGKYHVLGGLLETGKNGSDNAQELTIEHLTKRIEDESLQEIRIATNPTSEGDLTALYLRRKLSEFPTLKISRIARGIATGGDIEYADEQTLAGAMKNRQYYTSSKKP